MDDPTPEEVRKVMRWMGKRRLVTMTRTKRRQLAYLAARKRWQKEKAS